MTSSSRSRRTWTNFLAVIAPLVATFIFVACRSDEPQGAEPHCAADSDCSDGAECHLGQCVAAAACPGGQVLCAERCVDYDTDPANCGGCGNGCVSGELCAHGRCALTCGPSLVECDGRCTDPLTDRVHCGASGDCTGNDAGETCGPGFVCSAGACALTCQPGLVDCSGTCIDPLTNRLLCGATEDCAGLNAGERCAAGEVCTAGACELSCPDDLVGCGHHCIDPRTHPAFCGAEGDCDGERMGEACAPHEACVAGDCVLACPDDLVACDGACVDAQSDPLYCGAHGDCQDGDRGEVCGAEQFCAAGTCFSYCAPGLGICEGVCHDLLNDPERCGGCDVSCPQAANASPICIGGECGHACEPGWGACVGDPNDGCATDLSTDVNHCNGCGFSCPHRPNSTRSCAGGSCGYLCNAGWGDCNGSATDGCEANLSGAGQFCGSCGIICSPGQTCVMGVCT